MLMTLCLAFLAACGGGGGSPAASTSGNSGGSGVSSSAPTTPTTATATTANATAAAAVASASSLTFSFSLPSERTTSAGVYTAEGRLLRTLWRGERIAAGSHTRSWDLRQDDGALAPAGPVTVRLVHHDVQYQWQGVIGNTSYTAGSQPYRSFLPPASLAIDGNQVHIGAGYNEGQSALQGFSTAQPQRPAARVQHIDPFIGFGLVASDGDRLYAANTGGLDKGGFVLAFQISSGAQVAWPAGTPLCLARLPDQNCYPHQTYLGVIARRATAVPTGLAVQRSGNLLAVAYGSDNTVELYDKVSGRFLKQWSVPLSAHSSNQLAMSAAGDLWVVAADRVLRYTDLASTPRLVQTLSGLERPLALAADPADDALVWVADGGSAQQLKRFDRNGTVQRRIGQAGGMQGRAAVAADRFLFQIEPGRERTALALDGEGHLWMVDPGNNRLLQMAADGTLLNQVAWLPASYVATADSNRPERVFANYLEFQVDHTRALGAAGAWTLVRNWRAGLPAELADGNSANWGFGGFQAVHTLGNGRSYGMLEVGGQRVIVELTATGTVREVLRLPRPLAGQTSATLYENGELGWAATEGDRQVIYRRALEGFDAAGNPRWAAARALASMQRADNRPWFRTGTFSGPGGPWFPTTASGQVLMFDPNIEGADRMHLGSVSAAGDWTWLASPSGAMDGRGSFQTRAQDARMEYGGNRVAVSGRSIVYGYHGEFFSDSSNGRIGQANQFMHFLDNGLFLGQFGTPSTRAGATPLPGQSGNNFSWSLVRSGERTWLIHNDESSWGGVHRWEILGLQGLQELNASGEPGLTLALR